jgi:hypothetical protein
MKFVNILKRAESRSLSGPVQSVQEFAQTFIGLRLLQEAAAARAAVHAGMEIDQEPRSEPTEEATCDDPEVCRLSLDPMIVLGKSMNIVNIRMRAESRSLGLRRMHV